MRSQPDHTIPGSIEGEIQAQLGRLGRSQHGALGELAQAWPTAVGPAIAGNAWPARRTRDGTLVVHTSSSVWAQELTQLEEELRLRLAEAAPPRIRFVVGPVPEPGRPTATEVRRSIHKPTDEDRAVGRRIAQSISDSELRTLVAEAAAHSLAAGRVPGRNRAV